MSKDSDQMFQVFLVCAICMMIISIIVFFVLKVRSRSSATTAPPSGGDTPTSAPAPSPTPGPTPSPTPSPAPVDWHGKPPEGMSWDSLAMVATWGKCLPCYKADQSGTCVSVNDPKSTTQTAFDHWYKIAANIKAWGEKSFVGCSSSQYNKSDYPPNPIPAFPDTGGYTPCPKTGFDGYGLGPDGKMYSTYCIAAYDNCTAPTTQYKGTNLWYRDSKKDVQACQ